MKTISIQLIQGESKLAFSTEITAQAISVISGTIAFRIISFYQKVKKHKINLNGFSFGRKFDVQLSIDGEEISGTKILNVIVRFGITLKDNDESVDKFGAFIHELVSELLTGCGSIEIDLSELKDEIYLN